MKRNTILWGIGGILLIIFYGAFDPEKFPFPKCPFRALTGWLCPGCGSQRAMHQILHAHFGTALHYNLLFIPAMLYVATGYIISNFFPNHWPSTSQSFYGLTATYLSLAVILSFWIGRNLI